jgi:S1-C subfamily serine protease
VLFRSILTNAHVVSNQQRILITIHGSPEKYPAKVDYIAHDCDLAILSLEDFSDFEDFPVFSLGEIPVLESLVTVIGYPVGGERLSVTKGIVSRIDFQPYSHSRSDSHLVVQIDAAINPGNSGGPVLQDGKVVGVAFQGLRQADNTGYIIPTPVVKRFLKDGERGIKATDMIEAVREEFKENEDLPNTTNPDDWARISGRKGERIINVRTLITGVERREQTIENVSSGQGQYL